MRTRRAAAVTAVLAVALSGCSQTGGLSSATSAVQTETNVDNVGDAPIALAGVAQPAAPLPAPSAPAELAPLAQTVTLMEPDLLVETRGVVESAVIEEIRNLVGMQHTAPVAKHDAQATGPDGTVDVDLLAVNPVDFRPLTPEVTAQSVGVWERLAAGEVVLRHDVAAKVGVELGGDILLATPNGATLVRVGAFASNGTPPVSGIMVPWSVAAELGITQPTGFVLAVTDDDTTEVELAIASILGDTAVVERRKPPQQLQATVTSGGDTLQPFSYTDNGDGTISIEQGWVDRYIKTVTLPGIATTRCHELMIPQLLAALDEVRELGLYGHFKPEQFGGCYYPRHIDWDPAYPLSNHAWGIAVDFNTHDNWLGDPPQMDMRIVEVFERWGFEWGGRWRRPDGMHFELARIVRPG
ncbi:MAG: hypothetical protein ACI970_000200 [Myxococcota bacterium]